MRDREKKGWIEKGPDSGHCVQIKELLSLEKNFFLILEKFKIKFSHKEGRIF